MANLLKKEKSPYLKQHENNHVDWFAWNKETLQKAKIANKISYTRIFFEIKFFLTRNDVLSSEDALGREERERSSPPRSTMFVMFIGIIEKK